MVNVRIHFTGLCGFIPKLAIDQPENAATVALVEAREAHHAHYCVCFAEPTVYQYDPDGGVHNRPVNFSFNYEDTPGVPLVVNGCHLNQEHLTVVGRTAEGVEVPLSDRDVLTFIHGVRDECPVEDDDDEEATTTDYFNWVAEMDRVGAGRVNPAVVDDANGGGLLGARMRLNAGSLRCSAFRDNRNDGIVRWIFGGVNSALAEEVAWDFTFPDESKVVEIIVRSEPLGGDPAPELVLRPDGDLVEAWIVNMPLGSLMGIDPVDPLAPDTHFTELFRLSARPPRPSFPVPDPERTCPPLIGASNPKCPPAVFLPYP